jgi:hypothetical protein
MFEENELQNDLNEAALLELPRGPGRPPGGHNRSDSRTEVRKRVAAHRERKRIAAEEVQASQEKLFRDMRELGFCFFGETAPLQNCTSIAEEVEMARLWAKLLNVPEIRPGQNQKNYVLEVMKAWCIAECPLLHLESQTLSRRFVDVPDIEKYEWLPGSDRPFEPDQETQTETTNA